MTRWLNSIPARALVSLAFLAASSFAAGCASHVEGGGSGGGGTDDGAGGGGGDGSGGGGGGEVVCSSYDGCTPGQTQDCTSWPANEYGLVMHCNQVPGKCEGFWNGNDCSTPLVLSFDRAPVDFTPASASFAFDLTGTGATIATDWPTARTPWLALDRDGDGRITGGEELFGSATRLADGGRAVNGFVALRELDDNGDGRITPEDRAWPRLVLWSDRDGDRASTAAELAPLAARRLLSIDLGYTMNARCDARGNCEVERATFRYLDDTGAERAGEIIDVHLKAVAPLR